MNFIYTQEFITGLVVGALFCDIVKDIVRHRLHKQFLDDRKGEGRGDSDNE